jgi:hypothetical protein
MNRGIQNNRPKGYVETDLSQIFMTRIPAEKHYSAKERALDPWIRLANLLPSQEPIPEPSIAVAIPVPVSETRGWLRSATTPSDEAVIEKVRKWWEEHSTTLPQYGGSAADRYEIFYAVRETLRDIVREISAPAFKRPATRYGTAFGAEIRTFGTRPPKIVLVGSGIYLTADVYGVFLNVLEQAGEEIYRLKFCPICAAIFQPRRKDQRACTPRCANVLRVREQRHGKYERTRQRAKDRKQKKR